MANTLKFGAGNWATKEGSTLAYNDSNSNFKPLPFNFSRASKATVVNKDGLIEEVGSGQPRIDFLGNTKGALLLEPSRSNVYTQSNLFSFGGNVTSNNSLSPDGTLNASKITKTSSSDQFVILPWSASLSTSTTYSLSFFVKHNGDDLDLRYESNNYNDWGATPIDDGGVSWNALFEVRENSVIASTVNNCTSNVINFGNGWYRVVVYVTTSSSITPTSPSNLIRVIGSDTKQFLMYGAMFEQGSYSTSLINTQGTIQTRLADSCSQTTPDGVIGQTEGVVYMCFLSVNNFNGSSGNLFEIKEDNNNRINIYFSNGTPRLFGIENSSGVFNQALSLTTGSVCKLAIKYNSTSTKVFINGSLSHTLNGINNIAFNDYSFSPNNNIDYNEIKLYNTALSDSELAALTQV